MDHVMYVSSSWATQWGGGNPSSPWEGGGQPRWAGGQSCGGWGVSLGGGVWPGITLSVTVSRDGRKGTLGLVFLSVWREVHFVSHIQQLFYSSQLLEFFFFNFFFFFFFFGILLLLLFSVLCRQEAREGITSEVRIKFALSQTVWAWSQFPIERIYLHFFSFFSVFVCVCMYSSQNKKK